MTATLISLTSIVMGILGANLSGLVFKRHSFGLIGNTIAGVFGSIFIIKSFGRLGFDPHSIVHHESVNYALFVLNCFVSFISGALAVPAISLLKTRIQRKQNTQK